MKIVDFFKKSVPAKIGGLLVFFSLMVLISVLSLKSLPEIAATASLNQGLGVTARILAVPLLIGTALMIFSLFKIKFGSATSVFLTLLSLETFSALIGLTVYLVSLLPNSPFLAMGTLAPFLYFFGGLFMLAVSLICAIATAVCFILYLTVKKSIRAAKGDKNPF